VRRQVCEKNAIIARFRINKKELVDSKRNDVKKVRQTLKESVDSSRVRELMKKRLHVEELKTRQAMADKLRSDLSASRLQGVEHGRTIQHLNRRFAKVEKDRAAAAQKNKENEFEIKKLRAEVRLEKRLVSKAGTRANNATEKLKKYDKLKSKATVKVAELKVEETRLLVQRKEHEMKDRKQMITLDTEKKVIVETCKARIKRKLQGSAISKKKKAQRAKKNKLQNRVDGAVGMYTRTNHDDIMEQSVARNSGMFPSMNTPMDEVRFYKLFSFLFYFLTFFFLLFFRQ
jgi:hypothetical protein